MFGVDWLFGASGLVSVVSLGLIVWGWLFRDGYLGLIELVVWDKLITWGWFVDVVCLGLVGWLVGWGWLFAALLLVVAVRLCFMLHLFPAGRSLSPLTYFPWGNKQLAY